MPCIVVLQTLWGCWRQEDQGRGLPQLQGKCKPSLGYISPHLENQTKPQNLQQLKGCLFKVEIKGRIFTMAISVDGFYIEPFWKGM